ncbi:MAG: ClbS/DfsB family four-helix bundle protein [Maritimibacter sp.]
MPAATCKTDLIAVCEKEYANLVKLLEDLPAPQAMLPDDENTSIKDVIAHRAHWTELFLGWYADGQAGKPVYVPAQGYKWNDLKRYNADLRARQSGMGWQDARDALAQSHEALMRFLTKASNSALYGGPMKGGNNKWTAGRWAEGAGPSHYRSAAKYIRARKKALNI